MEPIEVSAKKVDDALREGLRILGTTLDKVEYKVLSAGGLFKKAKISIALIEDESEKTAKKEQKRPQEHQREDRQEHQKQERQKQDAREHQKASDDRSSQSSRSQAQKPANAQRPANQSSKENDQASKDSSQAKQGSEPQKERSTLPSSPQQKGRDRSKDRAQRPRQDKNHRFAEGGEQAEAEVKKRARAQQISEEDAKTATDFVAELVRLMGADAEVKSSIVDGDLVIELDNAGGSLIGYRGEILDAIEYLVSIKANKDNDEFINIVVDSCGYRKKREEMLVSMAEKAAARCIKTNRKVIMEPMNRSSRKIVHSTLSRYNTITSKSEGNEPNRHIVIYFKRGGNR